MKKFVLATMVAAGLSTTSEAAVKLGDIAPNFTVTDINGGSHTLYNYLDSGYMVIIDVSAAWCGPCWSFHQTHVFNTLVSQYGFNGTISPRKIKVLWFDGEATNTTAQLYGPKATTSSNATTTQGDWVTGTQFPIIDNALQNGNYMYGGVPSFTVITRDRIVVDTKSGYSSNMTATPYWVNFLTNGPQAGPSATIDAQIVNTEQGLFLCQSSPKLRFQNYSQTQNITSATLNVYSGANVIATQNWTGNLAPYAVQDVSMPAFSQAGPYKFEVTTTGDAIPANNSMNVPNLDVITPSMASSLNYMELINGGYPSKYVVDDIGLFYHTSDLKSNTSIGPDGQTGNGGIILFGALAANTTGEILLGNFNTAAATSPSIQFDWAYHPQATSGAGGADKLEIMESTDCGATWKAVYSKNGTQLSTMPGTSSVVFIPNKVSDWRHETSGALSKNANLFLKLVAKTSGGDKNMGWIDNISVEATTTSVDEFLSESAIKLYPNPTSEAAILEFEIVKPTNISVQLMDVTGRVVSNIATQEKKAAGLHKLAVNTANIPSGLYHVRIQTEGGSRTERLTVVK